MAALGFGEMRIGHATEVLATEPMRAQVDIQDVEVEVVKEVREVRAREEVVTVEAHEPEYADVLGVSREIVKVAEGAPVMEGGVQAVPAFPIRATTRGCAPQAALFYFPGCGCRLNSFHQRMEWYLENIQTPLAAATVGWDELFFSYSRW